MLADGWAMMILSRIEHERFYRCSFWIRRRTVFGHLLDAGGNGGWRRGKGERAYVEHIPIHLPRAFPEPPLRIKYLSIMSEDVFIEVRNEGVDADSCLPSQVRSAPCEDS
jgi:hypothetical protein